MTTETELMIIRAIRAALARARDWAEDRAASRAVARVAGTPTVPWREARAEIHDRIGRAG